MKRTLFVLATLTSFASIAQAQMNDGNHMAAERSVHFGIAGGAAVPTGDFGKGVKTGYNVTAGLDFMGEWPVGVRIEGMYNGFSFKGTSYGNANLNISAGSANLTYGFPTTNTVKPYLIGGIGYYHLAAGGSALSGSGSDNKFGFNAGVGTKFSLGTLATSLEARFHSVQTDGSSTNFVPITFGVWF